MKKILSSIQTKEYAYTVVYEPVPEGGYQVVVPILPGLVTYGRTFEEARLMAKDAIRCYVEATMKENEDILDESSFVHEKMFVSVASPV